MITLRRLIAEHFKGLASIDLLFPERGSLLIEGHNEAGKSTLFEAIYVALYGEPLVGEESRARLEEVIAHGHEKAHVELAIAVGPLELTIRRTFARNRQQLQQATLVIQRPDAAPETINRIRAVNERLIRELGGLDGDSLRNSCFVEQQELGRLESLSRTEREQAVHKLLGLERLTSLAQRFRYTREQERTLQLSERRHALALAQAEVGRVTAEVAALRGRRDAAQVAAHLHERARLRHETVGTQRKLDLCRAREAAARTELQRCAGLHDVLSNCTEADSLIVTLLSAQKALAETEADLAEIDRIARGEPALQARLRQVEDAIDAAMRADEAMNAVKQQATARATLQEWVRLKSIETRVGAFEKDRVALEAEHNAKAAAHTTSRRKSQMFGVTAGIGAVAAILAGLGGLTWPPLFALAALFLLIGGALGLQSRLAHRDASRWATAHAALEGQLRDLTVAHQAIMQAGGGLNALADAEAALRDAGLDVPASLGEAQIRLTPRTGDDGNNAQQLNEQVRAAEAAARSHLASLAEQIGITPERSSLEGERGRVGERLHAVEQRLAMHNELAQQHTEQELAVAEAHAVARRTIASIVEALRLLQEPGSAEIGEADVDGQEPDAGHFAAFAQRMRAQAAATLTALNETELRTALDSALHDTGAHMQRMQELRARERNLGASIGELLAAHGFEVSDDLTAARVVEIWPLVAALAVADLPQFTDELEDAEKRLYAARERVRELETELDHDGTHLDLSLCAERVAQLRDERTICGQAMRVIAEAQESIARHVLPTTERNMQLLLPQLTAGRYRDVRLTAPEGDDGQPGEMDYRIRVWDPMAGRYVTKNLFSGGTRDQCSLALRLAFALATLPQELGVAPGFIILDEPLTAFDTERAQALVALLTTGTIAEQFAQVIVISHGHAFDRFAFTYHVEMERGRVRSSTLPRVDDGASSDTNGGSTVHSRPLASRTAPE